MEALINDFGEIEELINNNIRQVISQVRTTIGSKQLENGVLKNFIIKSGEDVGTVEDAMVVVTTLMNRVEIEANTIKVFLQKSKGLNPVQQEYLTDLARELNATVIFTSDMLMSLFMSRDVIPKAKLQEQISGLNGCISMYNSLEDSDTVSDVGDIPPDVPFDMVQNFIPNNSPLLAVGFSGNPFYAIGKMFKRKSNRRVESLKARCKYIELELLEIEMGNGKDSAKQKKYYLNLIKELEYEISLHEG